MTDPRPTAPSPVLCVAEITLGEMLSILRRRSGRTRSELAHALHIDDTILRRLENDDPTVKLNYWIDAFAFFGVILHADLRSLSDDELREQANLPKKTA
jgi:transcriptional regulator with XRE-family HTH domain